MVQAPRHGPGLSRIDSLAHCPRRGGQSFHNTVGEERRVTRVVTRVVARAGRGARSRGRSRINGEVGSGPARQARPGRSQDSTPTSSGASRTMRQQRAVVCFKSPRIRVDPSRSESIRVSAYRTPFAGRCGKRGQGAPQARGAGPAEDRAPVPWRASRARGGGIGGGPFPGAGGGLPSRGFGGARARCRRVVQAGAGSP
jgi:hypothetical protein